MKTITDIKVQKRGRKRVNIFLDGGFAFSLENRVVEEQCLSPGQTLSDTEIHHLAGADLFEKCFNSALRLLHYRPRSESELRYRLNRNHDKKIVEKVIASLRERGLINDRAFAAFWKENRETFSPRSKRVLRLELKSKGIAPDVIAEILDGFDDEQNAYQVALKKARLLKDEEYEAFHRKLTHLLARRGFNWEIINRVTIRVWQETR